VSSSNEYSALSGSEIIFASSVEDFALQLISALRLHSSYGWI
jgi:hypothetical protein